MKKNSLYHLLCFIVVITVTVACTKLNTNDEDSETILYEDKIESNSVTPKSVFLGGNSKKVTKISYENKILKELKTNSEWSDLLKTTKLNFETIKRTYLHNSPISLITFEFLEKKESETFFLNVYILDSKIFISKVVEEKMNNGMRRIALQSTKNELYYSFELNVENKMGNWVFKKEMPLQEIFAPKSNLTQTNSPSGVPCGSRKFNACMNCFILDVCGSDWMCSIACGLVLISCVGGAAAACVIL